MHPFKAPIALALMLLAGLATAQTAAASSPETVEGVIRVLTTDAVSPGALPDQHVLVVGDQSYVLTGEQGEPNTRVRVTGVPTGGRLSATSIERLGPAGDALATIGTTRVLVMLGHWRVPDSVTPQRASDAVFADSNGWYRDASYSRLGQTGDVTPWMELDGPVDGRCYADSANTMAQAKAAAVALGYDLDDYDNYILYSPNNSWQDGSDCDGAAAWAYVGSPNVWINGYLDRRVIVHEQGHNYGLVHSHSYLCDHVVYGSCTFTEYGDDFDAMGASGYVGHFSASQKNRLGWMTRRTVNLTTGGSAKLAPIAADPLSVGAAVVHASPQRSYWFEYRQPIDFDSALPASATDGVLVHLEDTSVGAGAPSLLDTRPGDGRSTLSATMRPGDSWTTPEGFTIAVGSATSKRAAVTVFAPGVTAPTVIARSPKDGATNVKKGAVATATFSKTVTGVDTVTCTITNIRTGASVPVAVHPHAKANTWTIDPSLVLEPRTRYLVTLTGGPTAIRDLAGHPLRTTTWRFTTGQ